jgi:hypothetical protein
MMQTTDGGEYIPCEYLWGSLAQLDEATKKSVT